MRLLRVLIQQGQVVANDSHQAQIDQSLVQRGVAGALTQPINSALYLARTGAKVVVWLSGHGGTEDYLAIRKAALTAMRVSDCIIWAGVDAHLITDLEKPMDHAAAIETSLLMHLAPETVDLGALDPNPAVVPQGVGGNDPRIHASETFGLQLEHLYAPLGSLIGEKNL